MTEFAIVVPILLLVVFAIVQLGIVYNHWVTLTDASRAGARKAAVSRTLGSSAAVSATKTAVESSATGLNPALTDSQVTVTSTWQPGDNVTVCAQYPWSVTVMGINFGGGNLSPCTTERVE